MKVNEQFVLRQVADQWILVPLGKTARQVKGMLKLNESGAMMWKELEQGADAKALEQALQDAYAIDTATAQRDVAAFLQTMKTYGCLLDEA